MDAPVLFEDLADISKETLAVLHASGFTRATPVQEATIPLFCGNKDVAVDAATGSGKTLAFLVPVVERLRKAVLEPKSHEVLAMVISPTRELAQQTFKVAETLVATLTDVSVCLLVGGTDVINDVAEVKKGANIMIGTPGRIDDVLKRVTFLSYKSFEVLVLDEADRLLEMGFQKQLDAIMKTLPKQRRTGLFSATQTDAVEALVRAGLRNPFRVNVQVTAPGGDASKQKTPSTLQIQYLIADNHEKVSQTMAFLAEHSHKKVIMYFLTCASVDYFSEVLPRLQGGSTINFMPLHGHMKQKKRAEVLKQFADAPAAVLLCTDLAARGLDIPDVHWILQYDPPQDPSAFVHRCGRTARMGRSGNALALLLPHEDAYVTLLENRHVPMTERDSFSDAQDVSAEQKLMSETNRDIMEKGTKAFVSYMRGYKEHHCKFIFRVPDLDISGLGQMFGLLRLPAMQEVRKNRKGMKEFVISDVDPASVPYVDSAREKQRRKTLARKVAEGTDAASMKVKRTRERQQQAEEAARAEPKKKLPGAKRQLLVQRQERCDMIDDYRLLRKLKKGKMSEAEFEVEIGYAMDTDISQDNDVAQLVDTGNESDGYASAPHLNQDKAVPAGKGTSRTVKKRKALRVASEGVGKGADCGSDATEGGDKAPAPNALSIKRKLKKARLKANKKVRVKE